MAADQPSLHGTSSAQKLTAHFQRPDLVKAVRDQLANLRQQRSVHEYTAKMRELALQVPDLGDGELMDRFVRGLKDHIRREVELHYPNNLEEAILYAERTDRVDFRMRNNRQENSRGRSMSNFGRNQPPATTQWQRQASSSSGPTPMEIGSMKTNSQHQGIVCYNCGKTGHIKRNCPAKRSSKAVRQ